MQESPEWFTINRMENQPTDLNLRYLVSEARQIDARVQRLVRESPRPGNDEMSRFRGLYISPEEAQDLAGQLPGQAWPAEIRPRAEDEALQRALREAQAESRSIAEEAQQAGVRLRLLHLREFFGLSDFEYHAFLVCLLPALDLRYERIYGFLQDDVTKKQAGVSLILSLLDTAMPEIARLERLIHFSGRGVLVRYHLLTPVGQSSWQEPRLNQLFEVSPALVSWLFGRYFPEKTWLRLIPWEELEQELTGHPFAAGFEMDWDKVIESGPLLSFEGPDADRRQQAAWKVAYAFNMPLLHVDLSKTSGEEPFHLADLRLLIRDACLLEAMPFIQGWERALDPEGCVPDDFLEEMAGFAGIFILSSSEGWRISQRGGRPVFRMRFELPSSAERTELWKHLLGEGALPADTLRDLAGHFGLTSGQIVNAVFLAQNTSLQNGRPVNGDDLFLAARQQSFHHLGQLAQKIEPRYGWRDIVLPHEELHSLHGIVDMMRYRSMVLEDWGVGERLISNRGISALFAGESGTGKTLAAQVIAAELQLDLYRIDLSRVVSKYIGETEKNLNEIFAEATGSNVVLFFDEADALFGKRSEVKDAHDRYANIETGYLLQRLETFEGLAVLATNLRANMDDAFTRRLNFIIHFPIPDEAQRLRIWQVLLPPDLPLAQDIDWAFLAHRYPLPGGNIRNALVAAAFLAAQQEQTLDMGCLLQAIRQEMQKMGRFIKEEDYRYDPNQA